MENTKENKTYMFEDFFNYYIGKVNNNIKNTADCKKINIKNYEHLYDDLYANLFKLAIRCLIRQLHFYKDNGLLSGATKEERFDCFEKKTVGKEFRIEFFKLYPGLEKVINDYIITVSNYICSLIKDFNKDRELLQRYFNLQIDDITDISIGKGDTHNGGKSVAIIYFEKCKMVYKPHSLKADYIFVQILNWINDKDFLPYALSAVKTLMIDNRGWQEFIRHLPCENQEEIHEYYYKIGCFLAIFQAIGTTDLHFENVIASGTNPMFIDMETIFTNIRSERINTVINTGLLPQVTSDYLIDVDISGVCGRSIQSQKMKMMMIKNRKTDEMLVDEVPAIIENRQNLVFCNNKVVEADCYSDILISGYQKVLDFLIENHEEFIALLDKNISKSDKFRTVLRHTQVYSKYLSAALHPDYLVSSDKRNELFQRLKTNCKDIQEYSRVDDEIATLITGDVPYYMFDYRSISLYSNNGIVSEQYFLESAREIIIRRISELKLYREANIRLIKKSLYTAFPKKDGHILWNNNNRKRRTNNERILSFAKEIIDNVFYVNDDQGAIYFINCLYNNRISLESINTNLYEGGGIILYLAAVGKLFKNSQFLESANNLLDTVTEVIKYKSSDENYSVSFSAFSGLGSLIYLNYILFYMTGNKRYMNAAEKALGLIDNKNLYDKIVQNKAYDYLGGISGVVIFMAHILQKQDNDLIKHLCMKLSEILENYINETEIVTIGLAHGLSGYAYTFVMLFKITGQNRYLDLAKELLLKEDELYLVNKPVKVSWCKGETGMCLARLKYLEVNKSSEIQDRFLDYYKVLITKGLYEINNMCLCHGIYGNIEIIEKINQTEIIPDDIKLSSKELMLFKDLLPDDPKDMYLGFHKEFKTEIFMTGLSGIFYSLLRKEDKNLPSILCLEV